MVAGVAPDRTGVAPRPAADATPPSALSDLATGVVAGDLRAVGRAISVAEAGGEVAATLVGHVFPATGRAVVVGVTGPPGVGKSTLVDRLVAHLRRTGRTVAVVAVDPSSAGSGGALLGDRVRMTRHSGDDGVFIRSMANRGHLGGLAPAATPAVRLLDAAGFDVVVVETVGVGQSEIEVAATSDCTVVVVAPGAGDMIQAAKSGVLEIGDVFVVNRADEPGAHAARRDLEAVFSIRRLSPTPTVVETVATRGDGVAALADELDAFVATRSTSGELAERRRHQLRREVVHLLRARVADDAIARLGGALPADLEAEVAERRRSPAAAADAVFTSLRLLGATPGAAAGTAPSDSPWR